ncbi:unnamed protein product [Paramecium primaurelia]|uniref:Uncharacterized protein n=2 Tax=Paramecium TaxID=5884 RepID=A0A8S1VAX6_9CILI|nr:unnamed protein product [Paramecium primaurelia]CAD8174340.1 unnamed protein product [Paramecium pentaurelia]
MMCKQKKVNDGFKLPRIEKSSAYIIQTNRDSLDFLLGKNRNHNDYDYVPQLKQEIKQITEMTTNRLARCGSQILDGSSQVFMPVQQTQRRISQMDCQQTNCYQQNQSCTQALPLINFY